MNYIVLIIWILLALAFVGFLERRYRALSVLRKRRMRKGARGYIYCLFLPGFIVPTVKIGRAVNVKRRIRDLKTAAPFGLWHVFTFPVMDVYAVEAVLHATYSRYRIPGKEWFIVSPLILIDILIIRAFFSLDTMRKHVVRSKELNVQPER